MEANKQMKSTWLVEQFLEVFKARPYWLANEIIETVRGHTGYILRSFLHIRLNIVHIECFMGLCKTIITSLEGIWKP